MPQAALAHHTIIDCPQNPVLASINQTLARWDKRMDRQDDLMERQAAALETLAAQGAIVAGHEKRLDKHDIDFREMFSRINDEKRLDKLTTDLETLAAKVIVLEKVHAKEEGEEIVEARVQARIDEDASIDKKFWTEFKIRMITPVSGAFFFTVGFVLWLADRYDLLVWLRTLISEYKG